MALKGTLKDFGIADILQLIGQQQKSGVLYLRGKSEQVEVSFVDGNIARAQSHTRKSRELLGAMLVASGLLTTAELDEALEIQKRTLKRLGDILVGEGKLTSAELRQMTQLQTSETIYGLFGWKQGTYEFVQQDVEHDPTQGPLSRPEAMLLEGFRRIDEWPLVQKQVPSMNLTFKRLRQLAPPALSADASGEDVDAALDAALESAADGPPPPRSIGHNERLVFKLADPEISAQRLSDLSRLGEFETCKALANLIEAGYLKAAPGKKHRVASESTASAWRVEFRRKLRDGAFQTGMGLFIVVLLALAARAFGEPPEVRGSEGIRASSGASDRLVAQGQLTRLMNALELYRLDFGDYPPTLGMLADRGLLSSDDLKYPYASPYHYRPDGETYVLLPPLY